MYCFNWQAPRGMRKIRLAILADWHWGSPQCKSKAIENFVKLIRDDKSCYWLSAGDLMEMALINTLGDVYSQTIPPNDQLKQIVELLRPIKDKCIGMISGNHSYRVVKQTSLDPDQLLAQLSGLKDKYYGTSMQGFIRLDNYTNYAVVVHHTTGGGRTKGGKINTLARLAEIWPLADIYIGAHTHADQYFADKVFYLEPNKGGSVQERIRHFTGSGAALDYVESYAHRKMMPPAVTSQVILNLGVRKHVVEKGRGGIDVSQHVKLFNREVIQL